MRYIDISWTHKFDDEPMRLVSEISPDGYEIRKLEFFRDGHVGVASATGHTVGTELGEGQIPALAEILLDPQFTGAEIQPGHFESLWLQHAS